MKKFVLIITAVLFGTAMANAATAEDKVATVNRNAVNSFIFVEDGVTFSVYPDGEFDFFIDNRVNLALGARAGNVGITFNSGFDYNPFVQYDDYGAIIQIENVPVFYDFYGRVDQIGNININYRNGLVRRVGGLNVFYNGAAFSHYTGYVNVYNRNFVYRPYFSWFARPAVGFCNVWVTPYRRYYTPIRYTWYSPYNYNERRIYAHIGREHRYNEVRRERATIYRNDKRVAVRDNAIRTNRTVGTRSNSNRTSSVSKGTEGLRNNRTVASNSDSRSNRNSSVANRTATVKRNTTTVNRESNRSSAVKRSTAVTTRNNSSSVRSEQGRTVTKRAVTSTPRSSTVSRTTKTYTKPATRSAEVRSTQRNASTRTVSSSPSRSTSTVSKSTGSRSVSKAPARSTSRSTTTRSNTKRKQ